MKLARQRRRRYPTSYLVAVYIKCSSAIYWNVLAPFSGLSTLRSARL